MIHPLGGEPLAPTANYRQQSFALTNSAAAFLNSNPVILMKDSIEIPFDMSLNTRAQIESSLAKLPSVSCRRHPHEILQLNVPRTVLATMAAQTLSYTATFYRCPSCPHNSLDGDVEVLNCAADKYARFGRFWKPHVDEVGRPVPDEHGQEPLEPDDCANDQFRRWQSNLPQQKCGHHVLQLRDSYMKPISSLALDLRHRDCPQCILERLGLTPEEARASFENFKLEPAAITTHWETCRRFAANPAGVLLLLGNVGNGKTHLTVAIMRELLHRSVTGMLFIRHRHFLAQHRLWLRPVPFDDEPPQSPVKPCQRAPALFYDDLTAITETDHGVEAALLDLFEHRIGFHKPTVITANLGSKDLEAGLGSRLFDRLRQANAAVLEFGFASKRGSLNADYLNRTCADQFH